MYSLSKNKFLTGFIAMSMLIAVFFQSIVPASAATLMTLNNASLSSYLTKAAYSDNVNAYHAGGGQGVFRLNGSKYSYCIESFIGLSDDKTYTNDIQDLNTMMQRIQERNRKYRSTGTSAAEKRELISYVLALSPSNVVSGSVEERIKWLVGQTLIWEITSEERDAQFNQLPLTIQGAMRFKDTYVFNQAAHQKIYDDCYNDLVTRIQNYWKIPSFMMRQQSLAKTVELDQYDEKTGEYYTTLTDTSGVLSYFDIYSTEGTTSINGNDLTIKTKSTSSLSLTAISEVEKGTTPIFWGDTEGKQAMVTSGDFEDPKPRGYLNAVVSIGHLNIIKKDNKGNLVESTSFKISRHADMSESIGTYTTDHQGSITIQNLPVGTYYIQEVSVPSHLTLDSQIKSTQVLAGKKTTYEATNNWKQSYIQVTKKDAKTNQTVLQSGVQFEIVQNNKVIETISTNKDGIATSHLLDYGTYQVREKLAPSNYQLITTSQTQIIDQHNQVYHLTFYNEPIVGSIVLTKADSINKTNSPQGDASLVGAKYALIAKETIYNPATGEQLFGVNETISIKQIGESSWGDEGVKETNGSSQITWNQLPLGTYEIVEVDASTGYLLDKSQHLITLSTTDQSVTKVAKNITVYEDVIQGRIQIVKSAHTGDNGLVKGLGGVEFTVKLHSDVLKNGWDNAQVFDTLITGEDGVAVTQNLPYGTYLIKESKTPEGYSVSEDFLVNISENNQTYTRIVNNIPFRSWLKLVKVNENNEEVILSHATFKLIDQNKEYVKQKVGDSYVESFTTNNEGIVVLPQMLEKGIYSIVEIQTPEGFLVGDQTEIMIFDANSLITYDQDGDAMITIKIVNERPTGSILLTKRFEGNVNQGISKAIFELIAKNQIIDPTQGTVLYYEGETVGIYTTDEYGQIIIEGLPLGTLGATYELVEIETMPGYVLYDEPLIFEFVITDQIQRVYQLNQELTNKQSTLLISKCDGVTSESLEGATLQLLNSQGDVIDEWISTMEPHLVLGLVFGESYTLREIQAPEGYIKTSDRVFVYESNEQVETLYNMSLAVFKQDKNSNEVLSGAHLQIIDQDGQVIDEWVSQSTAHRVSGLIEGQTYTLKELSAPYGYDLGKDMIFELNQINDQQTLIFYNDLLQTNILVNKLDKMTSEVVDSRELVMGIYSDKECTNLIALSAYNPSYQMIEFPALPYGEYYLKEITAPEGYELSDEVLKIELNHLTDGVGDYTIVDYYNDAIIITLGEEDDETPVKTGDKQVLLTYLGLSTISVFMALYLCKKKESE